MSDNQDTGPQTVEEMLDAKYSEPEEPTEEVEESEPVEEEQDETEESAEEAEEADEDEQDEPEESEEEPQVLTLDEFGEIQVQLPDGSVKPLEEIAKGTLMQSDYTRKTQELARQRQEMEAEQARIQAELAEKARQLDEQLAAFGEEEPDWVTLSKEDPLGYLEKREEWNQRKKQADEARQRLQMQTEQQKAAFAQQTAAVAVEKMPEWSDPEKFAEGAEARMKAALAAGFTEQELEQAVDYRLAVILEKAARYDAMQSGKKAVMKKKVVNAPKVLKPGTTKTKQDVAVEEKVAVKRKLSRPHSIEDRLKAMGYG